MGDSANSGNRCVTAPAPTPAPRPPAQPTKGTKLVFQAGCTEKKFAVKFVKVYTGAAGAHTTETREGEQARGFKKMNIGKCGSGYDFITSKATCEEAASALGLSDTTASNWEDKKNPLGCYYKLSDKRLWWNSAGNKDDDDKNRVSLCTTGYFYLKSKKSGLRSAYAQWMDLLRKLRWRPPTAQGSSSQRKRVRLLQWQVSRGVMAKPQTKLNLQPGG